MANTPSKTKSCGEVIREARVARNMSLRELAKRVGITPSYVSDIENDRRVPAEDVLRALSTELELDFDDLMARSGRLGSRAVRYMSRMPAAGVLFRRLSEENAPEDLLEKLSQTLQNELSNRKRNEGDR